MNYEEMKNIVLEQSAKDMMCDKNDFLKNKITVVSMTEDEKSQNRGNKKVFQVNFFVIWFILELALFVLLIQKFMRRLKIF